MAVLVLVEGSVKPEATDEMMALMEEILPDTRAYDGCQGVKVHTNLDTPNDLALVEHWDSRAHYEKYLAWRAETGVLERIVSLLSGAPSIRYFEQHEV